MHPCRRPTREDRKSTRLNSSHSQISYAVFCLKKKNDPPRRRYCRITRRTPAPYSSEVATVDQRGGFAPTREPRHAAAGRASPSPLRRGITHLTHLFCVALPAQTSLCFATLWS